MSDTTVEPRYASEMAENVFGAQERASGSFELPGLLKLTTALVVLENLYRSRGAPAHAVLEQQLFELMFDIVPADAAAILLAEAGHVDVLASCRADALDRRLLEQAIVRGAPVIHNGGGCSSAAIPMTLAGRVVGVLYAVYRDADIETLTAFAGLAAMAIHHAREREFLEAENLRLRSENALEHSMIGESEGMRRLCQMIRRLARGNSTVLIRGESGTGKELVARAIHRNGSRAAMPFVAINCAAVTETLLESEFFGHEKGAFTGAVTQKKGRFEVANGGTVFLDEIGELAPGLQAKLLRVLQEHEFERVGGTRSIRVDIRVIAATNRDLESAMRSGGFRPDLFYRLNVVTLDTPPLRERREDIPLLAAFFAQRSARAAGTRVTGLSDRARACLLAYDWPGNIRELENAIERAVVLGTTDMILAEDLPEAIVEAEPPQSATGSYHEAIRETKKRLVIDALDRARGNFTEAARLLDVHPNYLHRLATQLKVRRRSA
ncbi:MAG TPA: sigma 54-interacting transcriptional regulator [Bryobacteraceae bacterium]|nr:sigma 54-interacting transcriptional regulator [Bryobacteraceae bacterium]